MTWETWYYKWKPPTRGLKMEYPSGGRILIALGWYHCPFPSYFYTIFTHSVLTHFSMSVMSDEHYQPQAQDFSHMNQSYDNNYQLPGLVHNLPFSYLCRVSWIKAGMDFHITAGAFKTIQWDWICFIMFKIAHITTHSMHLHNSKMRLFIYGLSMNIWINKCWPLLHPKMHISLFSPITSSSLTNPRLRAAFETLSHSLSLSDDISLYSGSSDEWPLKVTIKTDAIGCNPINGLQKEDYPLINFWTHEDFKKWDSAADAQGDQQGSLPFLEHENGDPITPSEQCAIMKTFRAVCT